MPVAILRKALQPLTFSDGTYVPEGTIIVTPALATHTDSDNYQDPHKFDPFRYYSEKEIENSAVKHQFVTTSGDYVAFGLGKHAWWGALYIPSQRFADCAFSPGRFFAVNELKALMAYLLINYDIKADWEGVRPKNIYVGSTVSPDPTAKISFRRR